MFFELLVTNDMFSGLFELAVLIAFFYLTVVFRIKAKQNNSKEYKFISLGFFFSFLSILIPMIAVALGALLIDDAVYDDIVLYNDLPYYLTTTASIVCFICAAKSNKTSNR